MDLDDYNGLVKLITKLSNELNELKNDNATPLYFTYTNDEYGAAAKEWYNVNGFLKYVHEGDAGFDLPIMLSKEDQKHGSKIIWPGERELLHTGIKIQLPYGKYGRITHRSSTEKRHRLRVIEGIIDNGYRGDIFVQVHNMNDCKIDIRHGSRYAQFVISRINRHIINYTNKLEDSDRGSNGFGSTGI